jgi:mannose-6-phosphate isomerase
MTITATGQPRALHLAQALDVMDYAPAPQGKIPPLPLGPGRELLVACSYFALERWSLEAAQSLTTNPGTFETLTMIDGAAQLEWSGGALSLALGDSVVVPAALGDVRLQPAARATLLRAYVPDLEQDLLAPLRARGLDPAATVFH